MITHENIVAELLERVPEFTGTYRHHVRECDEVLLTVLFGDLLDFTLDLYKSGTGGRRAAGARDVIRMVMEFLEEAAHSKDPIVIDILLTGFLENLDASNVDHEFIASQLGPESVKLLQLSRT